MPIAKIEGRAHDARLPALRRLLAASVVSSTALLTACGGDSSGPDAAPDDTPSVSRPTLVRVALEPAGSHCLAGGTRVESGRDADGNGVLADGEVSSTQYVCHGMNAMSVLVRVRAEAAGANCAQGGSAVLAGADANANGVLDDAEASSTAYVCNGPGGSTGTAGLDALVALAAESAGANCAYGGQRVQSGLDANRNGVLDTGEATATSYLCSAAPADTRWVNVTGPSVQSESNTGYLANAATPVTVTLPASPAIGDWIKVTGLGTGGWTIAQNAGQRISTVGLPGGNKIDWTAQTPVATWIATAMSADGSRRVAAASSGELLTSSDAGASWTVRLTGQPWSSVAVSADGQRILAAVNGGSLYTSTDGGNSWANDGSGRVWSSVASSADGMRLAATAYLGQIWTSIDGGASWTARESNRPWRAISSSAVGNVLVAGTNGGQLFVSTDAGVTWTPRATAGFWMRLASSADGKRMYATTDAGPIWRSDDFGTSWEVMTVARNWQGIATSSDGRHVVATTNGGSLYESADGGLNWRPSGDAGVWTAVSSTEDGLSLLAAKSGSALYSGVRRSSTTPGVTGSLSGGPSDALHLQYAGGGVFLTISYVSANVEFTPR